MADLSSAYRDKSPSRLAKITLVVIHFGIVLIVLWMLFGNGISHIDALFGRASQMTTTLRRWLLASEAVFYWLRTMFTVFVFVRRRTPWSEVVTIAVWILVFDSLFAYFGGRNGTDVGATEVVGAILILAGSILNTGSEWQRHIWKQRPENAGHLLTRGFFQFARHINYFGDAVLFTGWVLLTGQLALIVIPILMLCGFAFANIPAQDRYLNERYGDEYRTYAKRTARLIPFIY